MKVLWGCISSNSVTVGSLNMPDCQRVSFWALVTELPESFILFLLQPQNIQTEGSQGNKNPTSESMHSMDGVNDAALPRENENLRKNQTLHPALRVWSVCNPWWLRNCFLIPRPLMSPCIMTHLPQHTHPQLQVQSQLPSSYIAKIFHIAQFTKPMTAVSTKSNLISRVNRLGECQVQTLNCI